MTDRSILFAGCLGFQGIKTEATGNFSKESRQCEKENCVFSTSIYANAFRNLVFFDIDTLRKFAFSTVGLLPTNSIKYEDFMYEGNKVFSGMGPENQEITFMRKKFFQSSLNYII